jgi:hypothetical protein
VVVRTRRRFLAGVGALVVSTAGCLDREAVTVGLPRSNPPFAYRSRCCTWESNPLSGFDVSLLGVLADRLDLELSFVDADTDTGGRFRDGSVRLLAPGRPVGAVDGAARFIGPTVRGFQCLLVRPDVEAPAALSGRSVLVPPGPGQEPALAQLRERVPDVEVARPANVAAARERFAAGEGAALLADNVTSARAAPPATLLRGASPDPVKAALGFETPVLALAAHRYGYLFGVDDPLGDRAADALTALRGTDRFAALRGRFFGSDGLPRGKGPGTG